MRGMNTSTGQNIDGIVYLQQRLHDVLTTPKNSRVMNREFGCGLFQRVDETMNEAWLVQCYSDIAIAVNNPVNGLHDFALEKITPIALTESSATFELIGVYRQTGQRVTLNTAFNDAIGINNQGATA
jgi:phage baseplate assembly protein W